jgi:RNA polymerase sigma-70 factor (ECF subfamily)
VKELYRRYPSRLYRFGIQVRGNPGLTKEMVQESFVRPWRTAGRFNAGRGSVGVYLTVIVRSAAADIRKRPSSRPLPAVERVALPPAGDNI